MKLAALFSGGKDSTFALFKTMEEHEVKYLVTFKPERTDSYMFHHPCIELTKLQAEALGIKQIMVDTHGEKEKELEDLENVLAKLDVDGIVSGALASNYQKTRIDNICQKLDLVSLAPLWNVDDEQYWKNLLQNNFKVMVTAVAAEGLDEKWLGRIVDAKAVEELKRLKDRFGMHMGFEGGEAETFVLDCPVFKKRLAVSNIEKIVDKSTSSGYIRIKNAKLEEKP